MGNKMWENENVCLDSCIIELQRALKQSGPICTYKGGVNRYQTDDRPGTKQSLLSPPFLWNHVVSNLWAPLYLVSSCSIVLQKINRRKNRTSESLLHFPLYIYRIFSVESLPITIKCL